MFTLRTSEGGSFVPEEPSSVLTQILGGAIRCIREGQPAWQLDVAAAFGNVLF